jgi:tetratricopeptide (TPR) repeat protein
MAIDVPTDRSVRALKFELALALAERAQPPDLEEASALLASAAGEPLDDGSIADTALRLGRAFERSDRPFDAYTAYLHAMAGDTDDSVALENATELVSSRRVPADIAALTGVVDRLGASGEYLVSQIELVQGRFAEAIGSLRQAMNTATGPHLRTKAGLGLARALLGQHEVSAAASVLDTVELLPGERGTAWEIAELPELRAEVAVAEKRFDDAEGLLAEIASPSPHLVHLQAAVLIANGKPGAALTLVADRKSIEARRLRALAHVSSGSDDDLAKATKAAQELSRRDPGGTDSLAVQAAVLLAAGDIDNARNLLELITGPDDLSALWPLASRPALRAYVIAEHHYAIARCADQESTRTTDSAGSAQAALDEAFALGIEDDDACRAGARQLNAELAELAGRPVADIVGLLRRAADAYTSASRWPEAAKQLGDAWDRGGGKVDDLLGWDLSEARLLASFGSAAPTNATLVEGGLAVWDERFEFGSPPDPLWPYVTRGRLKLEQAKVSPDAHNRAAAWEALAHFIAGTLWEPSVVNRFTFACDAMNLIDARAGTLYLARRAVEIDPGNVEAAWWLAVALTNLGMHAEANTAIDRHAELAEDEDALANARAYLAAIAGDYDEVLRLAHAQPEDAVPSIWWLSVEAEALRRKGDIEGSRQILTQIVEASAGSGAEDGGYEGDGTLAALYWLDELDGVVAAAESLRAKGRLTLLGSYKYSGMARLRLGDVVGGAEELRTWVSLACPSDANEFALDELAHLEQVDGLGDEARESLAALRKLTESAVDGGVRSIRDELGHIAAAERLPFDSEVWLSLATTLSELLLAGGPQAPDADIWMELQTLAALTKGPSGRHHPVGSIATSVVQTVATSRLPDLVESAAGDEAVAKTLSKRMDDLAPFLNPSFAAQMFGQCAVQSWRSDESELARQFLHSALRADPTGTGLADTLRAYPANARERLALDEWLDGSADDELGLLVARESLIGGLGRALGLQEPLDPAWPRAVRLIIGDDLVPADTSVEGWPLLGVTIPAMRDGLNKDYGIDVPGIGVTSGGTPSSFQIELFGVYRAGGVVANDHAEPLDLAIDEVQRVLGRELDHFVTGELVEQLLSGDGLTVNAARLPTLIAVRRELARERVPLSPIASVVSEVAARSPEEPLDEVVEALRGTVEKRLQTFAEDATTTVIPPDLDALCHDLATNFTRLHRSSFDDALATIEAVNSLVSDSQSDVLITAHPAACAFLERVTRLRHPDLAVVTIEEWEHR